MTTYAPLPVCTLAVRLAVEADARRLGLPRPEFASYWRWVAISRNEVAVREVRCADQTT